MRASPMAWRRALASFSRQRPIAEALGQCVARGQLHHQEVDPLGLFHLVDAGNGGMIQRRQDLGLALEARQPLKI
ncbi:MAG: hypothetical protein ACE5ID_04595 [Acidobacteriota bacterium]